jgi:hypothetical protein
MFESLVQHCCNYSNKQCLGAFFKFVGGEQRHWVDSKFANKACAVVQSKPCDWFAQKVIPGIIETDKNLALIEKWQESINPIIQSAEYHRKCKECQKEFYTNSRNKRFCDSCREFRNRTRSKESSQRHRKKIISQRDQS